ncbi:DnaD domain protein [Paenibacillus sp. YYML68]|uniref:DnaD domain protein n=1 Tax=Paenibacillus sp. YYML68 TaxID=2909250 RepID=UPI00249109CE|nr:DnaD domain protein [Paenibacillus sp. YYML68]
MRITNMLHFSEYHRFVVVRDFAMSSLQYKAVAAMYQPMVGAYAISVYQTLYHQLSGDRMGYSAIEQQRKLFRELELEAGERGRKWFVEQTSKLEAVGLLRTSRRFAASSDDYIYEYELFAPLPPAEFFKNHHLTLLLRDKIGKYAVLGLRDELIAPEPDELRRSNSENLSVPFYDLFKLNTTVDPELEQELFEAQDGAKKTDAERTETTVKGFSYTEIMMRFPYDSVNREYVERLKYEPEQLAAINYVAKKYGLYLGDMCKLLDEEGVFDEGGELSLELLQMKANQVFRQAKKRSEDRTRWMAKLPSPDASTAEGSEADASGAKQQSGAAQSAVTAGSAADPDAGGAGAKDRAVEMTYYLDVPDLFQGECSPHQYNYILRNEPYTYLLEKIFSRGTVPDILLDTLTRMELNYGMTEEVINVLIHYIYVSKRSWAKKYLEAIATDMLGKQILTFEQAVLYVREQLAYIDRSRSGPPRPAEGDAGGSAAGTSGAGAAGGGKAGGAGAGAAGGGSAAGGQGRSYSPSKGRGYGGGRQKPLLPIVESVPSTKPRSDAEREALRLKAKQLDGKV